MPNRQQEQPVPKDSSQDKGSVSAPAITLPKGGGAIRGIGEKFATNPVTGTGSMSVPIATSPGRSGFGPQLSLSYDSGAGNGPFGLGWNLSLPSITRKTDKGLPKYQDAEESDVFILSGAEDMVPLLNPDGNRHKDTTTAPGYTIRRYRPRIEGLFARIERWTNSRGVSHWRSISRDNITTLYGATDESRLVDPLNETRIFSWLICESYDDKGNAIRYEYKKEDLLGIDRSKAHEANRQDTLRTANRYIKRIKYGNGKPRQANEDLSVRTDWMFEAVFDYGEHYVEDANGEVQTVDCADSLPMNPRKWHLRQDPFSSYRAGFEVRTYRLCERVLMFHHFDELKDINYPGGENYLVRATHFAYSQSTVASFISGVTQSGYKRINGTYLKKSLPPVMFEYSQAVIQEEVLEVDPASLENLPQGLDNSRYQWVDLDGEGLSGMLTEQGGAWFYKRNQSAVPVRDHAGKETTVARFAPLECVATMPSSANLSGGQQLLDLAGDGQLDVVEFDGPLPGFFERTPDEEWETHRPFTLLPNISWRDPNLKFIDLTGDGHADVLITEDEVFSWYPSLAEAGFGPGKKVLQAIDEEQGPRLVFADGTQSIYLADMSGDGLTDLVRIRNGEVCYWPNLGYGRFGAKVTMDNAPWFDAPDMFDQRRIRLADIDGSGVVDILYLTGNGVHLYFNQSGNTWSERRILTTFPRIDNLSAVSTVDLLGNGTACLVWSSPLPGDARNTIRYIDLMGGQKPHLLIKTKNNLGAETEVTYAPSTKFYLQDKQAGKPWITKLSFPVHCVEKVTVTDKWRKTKFSSTYSYHHGYFDGIEREFRGFGRVEQKDVESYGKFEQGNVASPYITDNHDLYQPPIKTVTWYHTGAALDRERILTQFASEYFAARYSSAFREKTLPEPELPADLSAGEWREALRACKGMVLRQESYELDVDALQADEPKDVPVRIYSAATHNCHIQRIQPRGENKHAVFLVTESEAITYTYELDLRQETPVADPRIAHTLNLKIDKYGNILESVAAVYPRIGSNTDMSITSEQRTLINSVQKNETHLALNCTRFTEDIDEAGTYRLRMPCQTQAWEVMGIQPVSQYFTLAELKGKNLSDNGASEISYHKIPDGTPQKRLVECARTLFFADDLKTHWTFGQHGPLGLPYESYKLALTSNLLNSVYVDPVRISTAVSALDKQDNNYPVSGYYKGDQLFAGYPITPEPLSSQYWLASGRAGFASDAAAHFYLPEEYTDPFGNKTTVAYDGKYDLFIQSSTDALRNRSGIFVDPDPHVGVSFDYRVLAPTEMVDINGNRSAVYFDVLGMVIASAVKGKGDEADNLSGYTDTFANPDLTEVLSYFDLPPLTAEQARTRFSPIIGNATSRFLYHFGEKIEDGKVVWGDRPAGACAIVREQHVASLAVGDPPSPLQIAFECSDGMGTVLMKRSQAEPITDGGTLRWIVSGKTVFNNKGKPVKQYEPYFTASASCCAEGDVHEEVGVTPIIYYDAAGRVMRTEMPDGTISKVEFSPWHVKTYDANDTVLESRWYAERLTAAERGVSLHGPSDTPQQRAEAIAAENLARTASTENKRAARLAAQHADTPSETHLDSLGREVIAFAHNRINGVNEKYLTFTKLDAEGKPLWIRDARGNLVMQYITPPKPTRLADTPANPSDATDTTREYLPAGSVPCYDIAGNLLFQHSMDAGDRWMLMDAAGKPMLAWDLNETPQGTATTRKNLFYTTDYDQLHRPTEQWLAINSATRIMVESYKYRDAVSIDVNNLNGQLVQHYDPSGRVEIVRRDFKGNVLETKRRLNNLPTESLIDWKTNPENFLETETFTQITEFDALNRITKHYNWHRAAPNNRVAVYEPAYNKRGLLLSENVTVRARKTAGGFEPAADTKTSEAIKEMRYNVKGQKEFLKLGNGTITHYDYDKKTFRLQQLRTTRLATGQADPTFPDFPSNLNDPRVLQQLHYTYDPVGNITEIYDEAYEPVFFRNQQVEPRCRYTYDALYRLVMANGREGFHPPNAPTQNESAPQTVTFEVTDKTLRNYTQRYTYDAVGNIMQMQHTADQGNCHRRYDYALDSNRLIHTWEGDDDWNSSTATNKITYLYDTHGNMLNLADVAPGQHLQWDHRDMIKSLDLIGGGMAYYQYDAGKQRTRKRIVNQNGLGGYWERIYLGGYELYRRYNGANPTTPVEEIESHHLFEGEQRVLLVDDVITAKSSAQPGPNGLRIKEQTLFRYQYSNHLGSACLELDHEAEIISYEEYHPYGTSAYRAVKSGIEAPPKRYRYTGMERDEESGLEYHMARYYFSWLGRWGNCDPIGIEGGMNCFSYASSNPVSLLDKRGEQSIPGNYDPRYIMGQGFGNIFESLFGGNTILKRENGEVQGRYDMPRGGVGGLFGGIYRTLSLRIIPTELYPSPFGKIGSEVGASMVPILDPLERLVTGETVTGDETSRLWAATNLAIDVVPLAIEGTIALRAQQGSRQFEELRTTLRATSTESTGIPHLDRLAEGTTDYTRWKKALEKLDWKVAERDLKQGTMATTEVIREAEGLVKKVVTIDPKQATYLALLHESKHIDQVEFLLKGGMSLESPLKRQVMCAAEVGAYKYESRVINSYKNQSVDVRATEEYLDSVIKRIYSENEGTRAVKHGLLPTVNTLKSHR